MCEERVKKEGRREGRREGGREGGRETDEGRGEGGRICTSSAALASSSVENSTKQNPFTVLEGLCRGRLEE